MYIVSTTMHYQMIDIHCHRVDTADHCQIVSLDTYQIIDRHHDKQSHALPLSNQTPEQIPDISPSAMGYFSLGIHPWFIDRQNIDIALQTLKTYRHHPKLLAIGECGLDKAIMTDIALQTSVFEHQVELAKDWRKPLMIHCVRAFNELMLIKKSSKSPLPWIIHGFDNHPELAKQLLKQDCYLSFGKALLREQGNATKVLQNMPLDRLFLETDDAGDISISMIYDAAAKITGLTVDALRQQIFGNFHRVFFND